MDIIATVMLFIILITTSANIVSCEEEDGLNRPTHCPLGQYYAMAIKQCRSCVYPCRIDRKACRAMGCADYEATTAASTRSNSEAVHVNDVNVDEHPMRQRRKRRKVRCELGEFYDVAIEQCRSCSIPCSLSSRVCHEMGCDDYEAKTAASTRSNSEAVHVNDVNVDELPMRQRRKRRKGRCERGEYYSALIEQCRSCSIPCSLSSRVCLVMGCDGYKSYQTTTTLASTSSSTEVGTMLASSKSSAEVGIMARNNEFMYIIGGTGGASVLLFCVVIILAIWLIRLSREKKSKREKYMRVSYLNEKSEKEEKSLLKSNEQSTRSCLRDTTTVSVEETDETNMSVKNAGSDVEATDGSLV
ncbi:uncharacterized protein LOC135502865 isoform X1 [Lineus longissimus]|uniref:uncharacterized protein LOC135502865 isoform X1 n=1 Tax=Lineus longissimus TaxID=88925 RepID=UPI002B4F2AA1